MDSLSCTPSELKTILTFPSGGCQAFPEEPCSEVFPNIFLGDGKTAQNKRLLKRLGITHVLNAAQGEDLFHVYTTQDFYDSVGIEFYGVRAIDMTSFKLDTYFEDATKFIKKSLQSGATLKRCDSLKQGLIIVCQWHLFQTGIFRLSHQK